MFVPASRTNSLGISWAGSGFGPGYSLPISAFFIATPSSTLAQINQALASGQNLILTPGIYTYSGSINVTNPNTIVLGIGYADLVPQTGTPAITVADVDGVSIGGLLIDATTVNAPVLLQVGTHSGISHSANPILLSDIFMRVGGYVRGTATTSLQVDSNDVILDNMWLWRADHGTGAGWTSNVAAHGLVVNGDNVLATGLAVEHYQQNQVVWNGNGGETIFFQDEPPYDVPNQAAWMNGTSNGFAPYSVSAGVTTHKAYGLGVYANFTSSAVTLDSAITVPIAPGVTVTNALTYMLASLAGEKITHVVNDQGATVTPGGNATAYLQFYGITPLTVKANNATKTVGAPLPTLSVSYSGFVNGDTPAILSGSPVETTTATSASPAGLYPITVTKGTLAAANHFPYTFNFVNGTLSVVAPSTVVLTSTAVLTGSAGTGYTATVTVTNTGTGSCIQRDPHHGHAGFWHRIGIATVSGNDRSERWIGHYHGHISRVSRRRRFGDNCKIRGNLHRRHFRRQLPCSAAVTRGNINAEQHKNLGGKDEKHEKFVVTIPGGGCFPDGGPGGKSGSNFDNPRRTLSEQQCSRRDTHVHSDRDESRFHQYGVPERRRLQPGFAVNARRLWILDECTSFSRSVGFLRRLRAVHRLRAFRYAEWSVHWDVPDSGRDRSFGPRRNRHGGFRCERHTGAVQSAVVRDRGCRIDWRGSKESLLTRLKSP